MKMNWKRWPFALVGLLLGAVPAMAHEKWFVSEHAFRGAIPEVFTQPTTFGIVAVLIGAFGFLGALAIDRAIDTAAISRAIDNWFGLQRLDPKAVLAITIGVSLMGAGFQHTLFAPNLMLGDTFIGNALSFLQTVVGVGFVFLEPLYGLLGASLILLWLGGFIAGIPVENMAEELLILGIGIYFLLGEIRHLPLSHWTTEETRRRGYHALRILTGLTFLVLSTVKWFRPDLAVHLVQEHHLNFLGALGVSDGQFVFMAAITETLIALCILFRAALRPASFVALNMFLLTIYIFGVGELFGHLPIKAVLFLFMVNGHWHKGEKKPLG